MPSEAETILTSIYYILPLFLSISSGVHDETLESVPFFWKHQSACHDISSLDKQQTEAHDVWHSVVDIQTPSWSVLVLLGGILLNEGGPWLKTPHSDSILYLTSAMHKATLTHCEPSSVLVTETHSWNKERWKLQTTSNLSFSQSLSFCSSTYTHFKFEFFESSILILLV